MQTQLIRWSFPFALKCLEYFLVTLFDCIGLELIMVRIVKHTEHIMDTAGWIEMDALLIYGTLVRGHLPSAFAAVLTQINHNQA